MRIVSWNVNGLRACVEKGFMDFFRRAGADIFCIQETKLQEGQIALEAGGYMQYWHSALKKGYSGTAVLTRVTPERVTRGMGTPDTEGRVLTLYFPDYTVVNVYVPNSQEGLKRLPYRLEWEDGFRAYLVDLARQKPVIACGDFNVAHEEIDLKNPAANRKSAGFTDEERAKFTQLLQAGFVDTFRRLYPDARGKYTYWSYMFNARRNNAGWRIDYFCVSESLMKGVSDVILHGGVYGSDHCPIEMRIFE